MDWDISILQKLHKANLSLVSDWHIVYGIHFDSGVTVIEDTRLDFVESVWVQIAMKECVLTSILDWFGFAVELSNLHLSSGYTSGLAAEKVIDLTKLFWGIQLSNKDLVLVHLLNAESEGNSNGQRKTFWNGNNDEDNNQINILWNFLDDNAPRFLIFLSTISTVNIDNHADHKNDEDSC
jgi:hypothetical protein